MKRNHIIGINVFLMVAYSVAFIWRGEIGMGGWSGQAVVLQQWGALIVHIMLILAAGWIRDRSPGERRSYLLTALLVGLVGHGMCFYNGAANASWN
jgi:hypothetical protein